MAGISGVQIGPGAAALTRIRLLGRARTQPGRNCGIAALPSQNMASRFVFLTRSVMPPDRAIWYAALLTKMSMPPSSR